MSLYQVQQCLFDHVRALEAVGSTRRADSVVTEGYTLTPTEQEALGRCDIAGLYGMGVHPVIVNALARALGWKRADYRTLFGTGDSGGAASTPTVPSTGRRPRWLTS